MAKSKPGYIREGQELIEAIKKLAYGHSTWQVFQDFLELSAVAISNSVDWNNSDEREKRYLDIINQYQPAEQKMLADMLGILIGEMQKASLMGKPTDILGQVFHGLELHNKYHGQFFTPFHVCEFMGQVVLDGSETAEIEKRGYISVCEPCVGSGGMVIGLAAAMATKGINYQQCMCVTACDIDIKCVHMAYLQLSLYGIPAVIIHGNSLSMEEWSRWYTPAYMVGMWPIRERASIADVANAVNEKTASSETTRTDEIAETKDLVLELTESGQYRLF